MLVFFNISCNSRIKYTWQKPITVKRRKTKHFFQHKQKTSVDSLQTRFITYHYVHIINITNQEVSANTPSLGKSSDALLFRHVEYWISSFLYRFIYWKKLRIIFFMIFFLTLMCLLRIVFSLISSNDLTSVYHYHYYIFPYVIIIPIFYHRVIRCHYIS